MNDPNRTVDVPSTPADALDAGLAAGFGKVGATPRSSLDVSQRPVLLRDAEGESQHIVRAHSDAMPTPDETGSRYQLSGEIARGGMGAVLRGRDVELGRDLAVKVLLEKHAHRPEVARRFIEEAQIGGQLQHPGVVPVYDIGRFGARPFFTMKLVKGQTLASLLGEREEPSAERPRFLSIALQVCQTLAYAHAKGVIHRDLKPANIMVGSFGEVQVMDWGLAKVLAEGGIADEERSSQAHQAPQDVTTIRTARSTGSAGSFGTATEVGSLLGTPAYMPPEQANGDIAHLDRRADVFGLGAILCEILTGNPPYVGRSFEEVRRKACNGDLADALSRLDGCGADAELIALTKVCLCPEAIDRPKDAQAVADGLSGYLNGVQEKLRRAELAEAEAKAKAIEEAKRRRLTLALAATVLLALTLGGGGWLWVKHERNALQAQRTREVNETLTKAIALREQARTANVGGALLFAQAREQAQRALALIENGPANAALAARVRQLQTELDDEEKDRKLIAALDEARLKEAELAAGENRFARERAVPAFREAFRAYGLPAGEGGPNAAAERIRQRPAAVREAIVAALDEWHVLAGDRTLQITEPHREWLQAVLTAIEPDDAWSRQARAARGEKDTAKRRAVLAKLAASADLANVPAPALIGLAVQLDPVASVEFLRRAQRYHPADFWVNYTLGIALHETTPPQHSEAVRFLTAAVALRPESPGPVMGLGVVLLDKGEVNEAIAYFKKAIALDPKYVSAHHNLGEALRRKGEVDEAIACFHQAIALEPKLANHHNTLGIALTDKGELDKAIACFNKAIALDPKFANPHNGLGIALRRKGQVDEAIACYRKAIDLDPKYAMAHMNLGNVLRSEGQVDEAIACYRKAIEFDPMNSKAHSNLGRALAGKGQVDEAIACYQKSIALDRKNANAHNGLGNVLRSKGRVDEAIACYQKAIEFDPKDALAHSNLGNALDSKGQVDEAIACFKKAIALDPKDALAHINLGNALLSKDQLDEAVNCFKKAIDLDPKYAMAHSNLGEAQRRKGQLDEAIASFRKAIDLDPKAAQAHNNLGIALFDKGQLDEAIACFHQAIALDPKLANPHNGLGIALHRKGQLDEAIASFRKAIALDPKYAMAHSNLGNVLRSKGQLDEAIACHRKAIALDPKYALAHNNLGNVLRSKGQLDEAIACFKNAIALDPKYTKARSNLAHTERLAAVRDKLPAFQNGSYTPASNAERLALAEWCQIKKLHRTATRLYAEAFAADPKVAEDLAADHRYSAACHAALAAAGQGEDATKLGDQDRARLRNQALGWLGADLVVYTKLIASGPPAARDFVLNKLQHWQRDPDLASIHDTAALAKLQPEERTAFTKLWSDVAALLKKVETPATKETKP
jgi:serine/threonine-protein kinase